VLTADVEDEILFSRLVLPRDIEGRRLAAVEDFCDSDLMLDLLPVLEGPTDASVTSSIRFVPGRVERGRARPLTGRSSILKRCHVV
jgi:hypothetical protein